MGSMILRPRQEQFVARCLEHLAEHDSVLGVAPTGAGKTVMLSAIAGQFGGRTLVLQHREELVEQNMRTFQRVNPGTPATHWTARRKRWASQGATFAMVPTLVRSLTRARPVDLVVVDEAHHAVARSWRACIERARELNPNVKVLGVTATPCRGDKRGLGEVFKAVADQIQLGELIRSGHLVPPRARVLDLGLTSDLQNVRRTKLGEYDMKAVEKILTPATTAVIDQWRRYAGDRRTVVFCATTEHARHVCEAYLESGVTAVYVDGETTPTDRAARLAALDRGDAQVLVNVAVATEGFDCQPVSCVVLLRPSSFQSTLIQMIGRGLRVVDPHRYPGIVKTDCEVLDFGRSLLSHGGIESALDLEGAQKSSSGGSSGAPTKPCPACHGRVPAACKQCPLCAYVWPVKAIDEDAPLDVQMVELDLLIDQSPFRWWSMHDRVLVVTALRTWAVAFEINGSWRAFGGSEEFRCEELCAGGKLACVAAGDDWMRAHGDRRQAARNAEWLGLSPSDKQRQLLERLGIQAHGLNRYEAACRITLKLAKRDIERLVDEAAARAEAA